MTARSVVQVPSSLAPSHTVPAKPPAPGSFRGPFGPRSVGSFVPRLTRPAFERYGFSAATLITDWPKIVGGMLARYTAPERLKWPRRPSDMVAEHGDGGSAPGATLHLRVDPGRALDVQYQSRQIIERINAYFGYRAVIELRLLQAPLNQGEGTQRGRQHDSTVKPGAPVVRRMPVAIDVTPNPDLQAALERLAGGIAARSLRKHSERPR